VKPDERLLTVIEVARSMRVSNMTVYRLIKAGDIDAIRVGRNLRIRSSEIDRFLDDKSLSSGTGGNA
jgi:excisionase family DNA binding protein